MRCAAAMSAPSCGKAAASALWWAASSLRSFPVLQPREVERADGLRDELAVAVGVELLADDDRRRLEREGCDLVAYLIERTLRLGRDLAARLLEPALALGLGLLAHPRLPRLTRLPRLREDLLRVAARLLHERAVLLEELPCFCAGVVRLLDRARDLLAARVDHLLDRAEGVLLQHEERDEKADDRPDHQPRGDRDECVCA